MVKYIVLIALLICLGACDSFTSEPRFEGDVYSIAALLQAGKSINNEHPLYITKSSSIDNWNPTEMFVENAQVEIVEQSTQKSFSLQPVFDQAEMKFKWVDPNENAILPMESYRIEVRIPGYDKLISAQTTVPPMASVLKDYYGHAISGEGYSYSLQDIPELAYSESDNRYPLALNLAEHSGVYNMMAEMFCLENFSTSLEFTSPILGQTNPPQEMEEAYNAAGEGIRRIRFLGRFSADLQADYDDHLIVLKDYRQGFIFYGRYRISLFITDDNYYRYNYMPEGYLHGGVQNALGYFGSASGGTLYTKVIKP